MGKTAEILLVTGPGNRIADVAKALLEERAAISVYETCRPYDIQGIGHALEERRPGILACAGGDGLLNDVLNAMLAVNPGIPLGIIPAGSMNLFAAEAGIPISTAKSCEIILRGKSRAVDIGRVSCREFSRYFLCWACSGFDSHTVKLVCESGIKQKFGAMPSYLLAGIKTLLTFKPGTLRVCTNGREYEGKNLVVSNTGIYATRNTRISAVSSIHDGFLELHLFRHGRVSDILRYALGIAAGRHESYPDVISDKCREITVDSGAPLLFHLDEEPVEIQSPARIEILPGGINVLCAD